MKKNFLWTLLACIVSMTMSMTLVACGDDDDETTSGGGGGVPADDTTIVGCWKGYMPAEEEGDLVTRYQHQLIYSFDNNGKFKMLTAYYTPDTPNSRVEAAINSATSFDDVVKNANFEGELNVVYFEGDYSLKGDTVVLSIKEYSEYGWDQVWYRQYMSSRPMAEVGYAFKLANGKLTLSAQGWEGTFNNHHTLVGELSRVSTVKVFPEIPDPAPIAGAWTKDSDSNSTITFDLTSSVNYSQRAVISGQSPRGRYYQSTMVSKVGGYTYDATNKKVSITFTYITTGYYGDPEGINRVDVEMENIEEADQVTDILDVTVSGNKMTLDGETWTKVEE